MERKRCQVCDGPVVNGRCKLCGMPYRNDETLYHLNENRSDHYRHATSIHFFLRPDFVSFSSVISWLYPFFW